MDEVDVDLASVERLTNYALLDEYVSRCHRLLVERIFFAEGCSIVLSCDEAVNPDAASMDAAVMLHYFNSTAYVDAVARLWTRASLYLRLYGLVVLEVIDKDVKDWGEAMASTHTSVPATGIVLPVAVVPLRQGIGRLVYRPHEHRDQWHFIPYDDDGSGSKRRRGRRYVVYTDPAFPAERPVAYAILDHMLNNGVRTLRRHDILDDGGDLPIGLRGTVTYTLFSAYWPAQRAEQELKEVNEYVMDTASVRAAPLLVYPRRPMREIASDLIGQAALLTTSNVSEAAAEQNMRVAERLYERGRQRERADREGGLTHTVRGTGGRPMTKAAATRERYGRPHWSDDVIHVPEDFSGVEVTPPTCDIDLAVWQDRYAQRIARLFDLPFEVVVGNWTGGDETNLIDVVRPVLKRERRRASTFYAWVYDQTYAQADLGVIKDTLEARTPTELVHLEQFVAAVDRPPQAEQTGPRLRDLLLGEASPLEATTDGSPGAIAEPRHVPIPSVEKVRLKLWDLMAAKRRVVGSLVFHADLTSSANAVMNAVGPRGGTTTMGRGMGGTGGAGGAAAIGALRSLLT